MTKLKSKLPNVGTTIFTTMSKMANEYNAINLSQGFPNFPIEKELEKEYKKTLEKNSHQYLPMQGSLILREEIAKKVKLHYNREINPNENILITAGATQALFTIIQALVNENDEVVILDPSYDCYDPQIRLAGGTPIHVNTEKDFSINWNKVEEKINSKTRFLIINNPHNPGGRSFTISDIEAIEVIFEKYPQLLLLSDEVYEFIFFENQHISINSRNKIRNRTLIVSSFGKTFHVTGWKVGYIVAPKELLEEVKKVHMFLVFCVNSTAQHTLENYLPKTNLNELGLFYKEKRDFFRKCMKNSRFRLLKCDSTYFQVAGYEDISDLNDSDFAKMLTKKHGVAVIPISGFNNDKHDDKLIRFCFAKNKATIQKAIEILCKI